MPDITLPDPNDAETVENGLAMLVLYDENQWMRYNEEGQAYCKEVWIKKAQPLGYTAIALKLIPDPIFPMYGNEKPYIVWRENVAQVREVPAVQFVRWCANRNAPVACHVLAAYLDTDVGEWVMEFVESPPDPKFTHYAVIGAPL